MIWCWNTLDPLCISLVLFLEILVVTRVLHAFYFTLGKVLSIPRIMRIGIVVVDVGSGLLNSLMRLWTLAIRIILFFVRFRVIMIVSRNVLFDMICIMMIIWGDD